MRKFNTYFMALAVVAGLMVSSNVLAAVASDLSVSVPTTATSPIVAGSNITYAFNAINNTISAPGNSGPAGTVQVTVNMPTSSGGTTGGFVSLTVPTGWTFTAPATGSTAAIVVTNTSAALVNGTPQAFSLTAKISSAATGTNSQTDSIAYTVASGNTDPTPGNNSAVSAASTLTFSEDLQISVSGAPSYQVGGSRTVTITLTNAGPSDAPSTNFFTLTKTAGVTYSGYQQVSGVPYTAFGPNGGGDPQATFNTIPAGATAVVSLVESSSTQMSYTDSFTIKFFAQSPSVSDSNSSNDVATLPATVYVPVASDLSVSTPTTATSPIVAGSNITYSFNAINNTATAPANSGPPGTIQVTVNMPTSTGGTISGFVSLAVPTGWTFTAPATGSTAAIVVTNTNAALVNGTPQAFSLTAKISSGATGTNSQSNSIAYTAASSNTDPTPGNNSATSAASTLTFSEDLQISASGAASYSAGGSRTVTITLTNAGPSDAPATNFFTLTKTAGVTYSGFQQISGVPYTSFGPNGAGDPQATFNAIPAGATAVVSLVESSSTLMSYTDKFFIKFFAQSPSVPDTNASNDSATLPATVVPPVASDLSVSKPTTATSPIVAGSNITYSFNAINNTTTSPGNSGPAGTIQVTVNMPTSSGGTTGGFVSLAVPTGWTFSTPAIGSTAAIVVTNTNAALVNGNQQTFTLTAKISSAATGTNSQSSSIAYSAASANTDPAPANNSATSAASTLTFSEDLQISASGAPSYPAGGSRTVTITVTNAGPSDAPSIAFFTLAKTAGVTYSGFMQVSGVAYSSFGLNGGGNPQANFNTIPAGASAVVSLVESSSTQMSYTDNLALSFFAQSPSVPDSNSSNDTAALPATVTISADVSVSFGAPSSSVAGTQRSMTVTVSNAGPNTASNVVLVQNPATGASFTSFTQPGTGPQFTSSGSPTNTWTIAALPSGTSQTFTFTEFINAATIGQFSDSATVTVNGNNATDPSTGNNSATNPSFITSSADVGITFTSVPSGNQAIGAPLTYTVQISNAGPSNAYNVVITDDFVGTNTNLVLVSQSQSAGPTLTLTGSPGTNAVDTIASLPMGMFTFTIVAQIKQTVPPGTGVTNKVTIAVGSPTTDPGPNANTVTSSPVIAIVNSDVAIAFSSVSPASPVAGGFLTYVITLTNNGPTNATGVVFNTSTPANTTFSSVTSPSVTFPTQPAPNGTGAIISAATNITANSVVTITLVLNVNVSTAKGTNIQLTTSSTSTSTDLNPGNNTNVTSPSTSSSIVADVSISSFTTLSPAVTPPGTITYMFTVSNAGPSNATGIQINDQLPAGTTYSSMSQGANSVTPTLVGNSLTYSIPGSISPNTSLNFTIVVNVPSSASNMSSISDTVSLTTTAGGSSDSNLANNSATTVVTVSSNADLSIAITNSPNPVIGGNALTYTVTVTNNGPSDAQLPQLTFPFPGPNQVNYTSATIANNWTQTSVNTAGDSSGTFTATAPTLAAGSNAVFAFMFVVNANVSGPLVNTPTIFSSAATPTPDPNPADNSATNYTVMTSAQPSVSVDSPSVPEGDPGVGNVDFTISLSAANSQPVTVDYATVDGSAKNPFDYIQASGKVTFNPGDTTPKKVSIQIIGNAVVEPAKAFSLHLSNPTSSTIATNDGVCTITNDDIGGVFSFSATNYRVNETAGTATITVQRPAIAKADKTSVKYATSDNLAKAGVDYTATSGILNFGFGVQTQTFTVQLLNHNSALADATVNLTLSDPISLDPRNNPIILAGASASLDPTLSTATLTILARPSITSALIVHGAVNTQFSYTPTSSGEAPVVYSLGAGASLPPGLVFTPGGGFITGVPTKINSFSVPIIATNAVGTDAQTLTIVIDANIVSGGSNTLLDSDGDGYPDELEIAVGSDPFDAASTPLNIKKLTLTGIKNLKLKIGLDFAKVGNDSITLTGTVVMPPDFGESGKLIYFDIGGVIRRFALDANGVSKVGPDSVKFKIGKPGGDGKTSATFTLSIKKGDFQSTKTENPALSNDFPLLDDEGLTNATVKGQARVVPVLILLNSSLYTILQNQVYTATAGKSGRSHNP